MASKLSVLISALTGKSTVVDSDKIPILDFENSFKYTWITFATLKDYLTSFFASSAQGSKADTALQPGLIINDQTGTTYTLVLTDAGKLIRANNAAAITLTVPPNSSVAFSVGTSVAVQQQGAGQVSIAAGAGVTINSRSSMSKISARYGGVSLIKTASPDTWWLEGALSA